MKKKKMHGFPLQIPEDLFLEVIKLSNKKSEKVGKRVSYNRIIVETIKQGLKNT